MVDITNPELGVVKEKYIPNKEAVEFITFIRAAGVEDNDTPEIHYRLADKYFGRSKQVMIESFRGSAKSTLMEWFIIYAAAKGYVHNFGEVNFIAFVGDSAENGVKNFFRNIQTKIVKSLFLQQFITIKRCTNEEAELINVNGHQLNIKGYGMKTNIRGVRYNGARPDIVILDDVTTNEALTSETIRKTISDNFYKAIMPALHPEHYKLFVIGTPISEADILSKLRVNPKWTVHRFPVCEKFPCTKEEFVGNWEDRFTYEAVLDKYETMKADGELQSFYQEYMLEIVDLSTLLVDVDADAKWFNPTSIQFKDNGFNIYIATDFATSQKRKADYSVIAVFAINSNNDWFLIDGQAKRQDMATTIDNLFSYAQMYKPLSVGIESSGQQGGFISWIEEEMIKRRSFFTLAKKPNSTEVGIRPLNDKVHRFVTGVQYKFKQKKVWLPQPEILEKSNPRFYFLMQELLHELGRFTLAGGVKALIHDDAIDVFNQFSEMEKFVPAEEMYTDHSTKAVDDPVFGNMEWEDDEYGEGGSTIF